jgi:hypothetical protein
LQLENGISRIDWVAIIQHLSRTWMAVLSSSDLPDLRNLQPTDLCA